MVLPGHLAGGYLAGKAIIAIFHPTLLPSQINELLLIGLLSGEAPDIDLAFLYIEHRFRKDPKFDDHRSYITHAPLTWLLISLCISTVGFFSGSIMTEIAGVIILAGSWSHFILDSVEYGIRWLWPFADRRFRLREFLPEKPNGHRIGTIAHHLEHIRTVYWKSWTFWLEIIVTIAAAWVMLR